MHIFCSLRPKLSEYSDQHLAKLGNNAGLYIRPLSTYAQVKPIRQGFVLGFAAFEDDELEQSVLELKRLWENL